MTEQQILDKTIEYLNKYSNCFKNWRAEGSNIFAFLKIDKQSNDIYQTEYEISLEYSLKNTLLDSMVYNDDNIYDGEVISSEFRIAYNIIKDLASTVSE